MDTLGKTTHQIEAQKWDTPKREGGMKPDRYEPFPKMLYRAVKTDQGQVTIADPDQCQRIVTSDAERATAVKAGWHEQPQDALDAFDKEEEARGDAAAERAAGDKKLSKKAQWEAAEVEAGTAEHLGEIPEGSKRKR